MTALEIKGSILQLLARIESKEHLTTIETIANKFLKVEENFDEEFSLTAEQEDELRLAIEETYYEENLVTNEEALQVLSK